ncbi:acyl-CoA dehydrogenase [Sulfolobales archaeon HS-7]|nr:acyl-CoA dehydrogenase [Sulfolobales archaeon HS-7]
MDFSFSEDENLLRSSVRNFLTRELEPIARRIDEEERIPREFVLKAGEQKLWAPTVPEEYGGINADSLKACIIAEEFARADISMATAVMFLLEASWGYVLSKYGSKELSKKVLTKVTSGEWFLGIASTEPQGGSDVANIRTKAERIRGGWHIKGEKIYISGAVEAREWGGGHLLLAKTDPEKGHRGITMFFVPVTEETSITKLRNMGRMGISTSIVRYDVDVEEENVVGETNKGFYYAMDGFNHARPLVAAASLGSAEKVLEIGVNYVKGREAFGKKLYEHQGIAFEASELKTKLEMAKLLTYKAAWGVDTEEGPTLAAMAKLIAPQTSMEIVKSVMMWMGGYSYSKDADVERAMRGIFSYLVGAEGALNVMKMIISKRIFS